MADLQPPRKTRRVQTVHGTGGAKLCPFVSQKYQDIYFNPEEPEAEKDFVFILGNDLPRRLTGRAAEFTVAELGFGYGLNCALLLATARASGYRGNLQFFSVDEHLPTRDEALALLPKLSKSHEEYAALWQHREELSRGKTVSVCGARVTVFPGQVHGFLTRAEFLADAWFFDGFSPAKNPEMWSAGVMASAFLRTRSQGTFATYSSAGWVKRNLIAAGYSVQKVAGFAGKREMLTGTKK